MKSCHRWLVLLMAGVWGCAEPVPPARPAPPPQWDLPALLDMPELAHGRFPKPLAVDDATDILMVTTVFVVGNTPPKRQVHAFNLLLDQRDAEGRFAAIAESATTAGRLYAFCGLRALQSSQSELLASELQSRELHVLVHEDDRTNDLKTTAQVVALISTRHLWEEMRRAKQATTEYFDGNVSVRVENATNSMFDKVVVGFPEGTQAFGRLPAHSVSPYRRVGEVYNYVPVRVVTSRRTFEVQIIDYVGEQTLPPGRYTFQLSIVLVSGKRELYQTLVSDR